VNSLGLPEVCVVYLVRDAESGPEVLLGRKLTGLGKGKVVAPGGKLEQGESPRAAAARELFEEVGIELELDLMESLGVLTYLFPTKPEWNQLSWAFRAHGDFGAARASAEIDAGWVSIFELPTEDMWDDAKYWLPAFLGGLGVVATFEFGPDLSTVVASDHRDFGTIAGDVSRSTSSTSSGDTPSLRDQADVFPGTTGPRLESSALQERLEGHPRS